MSAGIGAGTGAAFVMLLLMAFLRLLFGLITIPELLLNPILRIMGGQTFSDLLDSWYYAGRPLLFATILEGTLLLGAFLGLFYAALARPNMLTGNRPALLSGPWGGALYGLLIASLLNAFFLPLVGQPPFASVPSGFFTTSPIPLWLGLILLAFTFGLVLHLLLMRGSSPRLFADDDDIPGVSQGRRDFLRIIFGAFIALAGGAGFAAAGTVLTQGGFQSPVTKKNLLDDPTSDTPALAEQPTDIPSTPTGIPATSAGTPPTPTPHPTSTSTSQPRPTNTTAPPPTVEPLPTGTVAPAPPTTTPQPPTEAPAFLPTSTSAPSPPQSTPPTNPPLPPVDTPIPPTATPPPPTATPVPPTETPLPPPTATPIPTTPRPRLLPTLTPSTPAINVAEITPNSTFYHVSKNFFDPQPDATAWRLEIKGLVSKPYTLTYNQLTALPSVEVIVGMMCISNPRGGNLIGNTTWRGVRLADLLAKAKPKSSVVDVAMTAADGYTDSITYKKALDPDVVLVWTMGGATLTYEHGYPARLLVPGIYGMKHVKWLTTIELVDYNFKGFWQQPDQGWSEPAPVNTMSQIESPDSGKALSANRLHSLSGIAFAGDRSISRVEISLDAGSTWADAYIKPRLSDTSWVVWGYNWTPTRPGKYTVQVRATDGQGNLQTSKRADPYPNGSTGWHTLVYTVK